MIWLVPGQITSPPRIHHEFEGVTFVTTSAPWRNFRIASVFCVCDPLIIWCAVENVWKQLEFLKIRKIDILKFSMIFRWNPQDWCGPWAKVPDFQGASFEIGNFDRTWHKTELAPSSEGVRHQAWAFFLLENTYESSGNNEGRVEQHFPAQI